MVDKIYSATAGKKIATGQKPEWILKDLPRQLDAPHVLLDGEGQVPVKLNELLIKETREPKVQ